MPIKYGSEKVRDSHFLNSAVQVFCYQSLLVRVMTDSHSQGVSATAFLPNLSMFLPFLHLVFLRDSRLANERHI